MNLSSLLACSLAALMLAACAQPTEEAGDQPPAPASAGAESPAAPAAAGLSDASTTRDVHVALIIPGSNALFAAESAPPADDAAWPALQTAAQQVIDGAELLKTGSRPEGRAEWIAHADAVIAATRVTAEALAAKNADDLVFTNGDMMTGCTACHQQFRNVPAQ
jgi:hypothetical protein